MRIISNQHELALWALFDSNREFYRERETLAANILSRSDVSLLIDQRLAEYRSNGGVTFVILMNQQLVGMVAVRAISWNERKCSIGYLLGQEFTGRGLGFRVLSNVLNFAFEELGMQRIEATTSTRNLPSIALLEKLDFHREGILHADVQIGERWIDDYVFVKTKKQ